MLLSRRALQMPVAVALLAIMTGHLPAAAQGSAGTGGDPHRTAPKVVATRAERAIKLDGRLDDPAWNLAEPATGFRQTEPVDGAPASQPTAVRIVYDDEAIYVGARLDDRTGRVSSRLGRRDSELTDSDWFIVVFDSYHDHLGGYRFKVNPSTVMGDEANGERSWNPVWTVATSIDSLGWTAEMRIPFSQLRFGSAREQEWGIQFYREIRSTAEKLVFSYSSRGERGGPSRFGHLEGLRDIKRGKSLEVLPYVGARAEYKQVPVNGSVTFANPFRDGHDYFRQYGADVKYRLTSNFTVDATINPDFGQVEADESQVNLSANEQFFREQRPFFIEGANTFRFGSSGGGGGGPGGGGGGGPQILYSRRVGRAPQGGLPRASRYGNVPDNTRILGAAKITGRTARGWSIGVMETVTGQEQAAWADSLSARHLAQVEPLTNYLAARVRRDMRAGQSNVGAIVTAVHRDLGDSALSQRLRTAAYVSGLDFSHTFAKRTWDLSGYVLASSTNGDSTAITSAQRASSRFYQRPDAAYLEVDSAATVLRGWSGALSLAKVAGLHWTGNVRANATSPGLEINDLGFLNTTDRLTLASSMSYDERLPGKRLRKWGVGLQPELRANFGGDVIGRKISGDADGQLMNFISGRVSWSHDFAALDDRLTRGGPLSMTPAQDNVSVNVTSDMRNAYTWNLSASQRWDRAGGWAAGRSVRVGFKPFDWWSGELAPNYNRSHGAAQYVTAIADPTASATYGRRYLFAEIDQTTLSLQTRLNVTMSPRLTLSVVAEPFIASGQYGVPRELAAPRVFAFNQFGRDVGTATRDSVTRRYVIDPDGDGPAAAFSVSDNSFTTRSLNGTASLRWEWHPGATMYLVWQQRRNNPAAYGDFALRRDARGIFDRRADNTLLFKVSYWLNP